MKPYKFIDKWIDLDHVLSITEPRDSYTTGNDYVVPVLFMFRDDAVHLLVEQRHREGGTINPANGVGWESPEQVLQHATVEYDKLLAAWMHKDEQR
jgi:hypothetical protein